MNYREFMERVKEKIALLSEEEKSEWIYERARQTAEGKREEFLCPFSNEGKKGRENESSGDEEGEILDWIGLLENREIWFEKNIPEYMELDYWDMYPEAQFEDPFDISGNLQRALKTFEDLVDRGLYHEAPKEKEKITIAARNESPEILCAECGKNSAKWICTSCLYSGELSWICEECEQDHSCDQEMFLPVVNSPRCGICAYSGSEIYGD